MPVNSNGNPLAESAERSSGKVVRQVESFYLAGSLLPLLLLLTAVLSFTGCGPASQGGGGEQGPSATGTNVRPELSDQIINEQINNAFIREIPEENGAGDPIYWSFDENEPKEITVVEKQVDGTSATIVLDIKTRSAQGVRNPRELAGQIRTEWRLQTGWVLRKWEIVGTENISMKYKNLPRLPANNSNS